MLRSVLLWMLLLRVVLDFSYVQVVSPIFSYEGYILDFNLLNYISSWLIYALYCLSCPGTLKKVSDYFFVTLCSSLVAPLSSFYGLSGLGFASLVIVVSSGWACYFFVNSKVLKGLSFKGVRNGEKVALSVSSIMVCFLLIWYVATGAILNFNLDLAKVYEFRSSTAELANVGLLRYLNLWIYQVLGPFLLAYSLFKRWWCAAAIVFAVQVIFFAVSAHKSVLFYPVMILIIWWYFSQYDRLYIFPAFFFFIVLASVLYHHLSHDIFISSMFIRRVFYVPAILTYEYYEFFSINQRVFWSNSVLSWIFEYPYDERMTKIIGHEMGTEASANNGYISSGYAHAGIFGVALYTILIAFILKTIDVISVSRQHLWLALALFAIPLRTLILSSDLFTTMLTHGLLLSLVILILLRKKTSSRRRSELL